MLDILPPAITRTSFNVFPTARLRPSPFMKVRLQKGWSRPAFITV